MAQNSSANAIFLHQPNLHIHRLKKNMNIAENNYNQISQENKTSK
jgi:hypothetical protein